MFSIRLLGIEADWRENIFKRKSALLNQKYKDSLGTLALHDWSFVSLFTFSVRTEIRSTRNCGSQGRKKGKRLQAIIHQDVTKISFMCQVVWCRWCNLALSCITTCLSPHFLKLSLSLAWCLHIKGFHFLCYCKTNTDFKTIQAAQDRTN